MRLKMCTSHCHCKACNKCLARSSFLSRWQTMVCRHIRHPGYLGFLVWCVGTQLLLVNPICCVVFALVVSTAAYRDCHTTTCCQS